MKMSTRTLCAGLLASLAALSMVGCGTKPIKEGEPIEPAFPADRILAQGVIYPIDVEDPWEGFNRTMYRFNYHFDRIIFLPAVRGYQAVTPDLAEKGIHNFFNNVGDITNLYNSILQAEGGKALETAARLVWNTTAGLLGFIDVASEMDLTRHNEDFGQTMGVWGFTPGPYLVLPIFGPSSARDGIGLGVDWVATDTIRRQFYNPDPWGWESLTWMALEAIDTRANVAFRYYETGSAFEYEMVRMLYTAKREIEVAN